MKHKNKREKMWPLSSQGKSLFESLHEEPERTQVLITTTFLDNGLERCLRLRFKKEGSDDNLLAKLFNQNHGLLFAFAAKTWVARAIGLIDQDTYEAFDAVRAIRNACAHEDFKITLSDPSLEDEMSRLHEYVSRNSGRIDDDWEHTYPARLQQSGVAVSGDAHLYFVLAAMLLFTSVSVIEFDLNSVWVASNRKERRRDQQGGAK